MIDPGALLATTHEAGGGLRVRLRLCRPSDARRVSEFLDGLSQASRRHLRDARDFTFYNPRERLVVAAVCPHEGGEALAGLADCTLLATGLAELAVVVDDDAQGRGVGKLLTEAVAALARHQGATHLRAELPEDGAAMLRLMERLGTTVQVDEDGALAAYTALPGAARAA